MCVQSITGVMIQCFMAGIVFAKLSRPKNRSQTLMFSRYACICLRDGKLCFMFRVGDMRKSHIIGTSISAQVIRRKTTAEGEVRKIFFTRLKVYQLSKFVSHLCPPVKYICVPFVSTRQVHLFSICVHP